MNDQQTQLLSSLADKLGVTVQHLWTVLLRQAPIAGITDLVLYAALIVATYAIIKWSVVLKDKCAKDDDMAILWLPTAIVGVIIGVCVAVALSSLSITIAAFLNPEYWALHDILSSIRSK